MHISFLSFLSAFLLEIGTEELPADFAHLALAQLEELVRFDLAQRRLLHGEITCTSTPRRIAVLIEGLADSAEDLSIERKGPPADKAFVDDCPTSAARGFVKSLGAKLDDLEVRETSKGLFVFIKITEKGESAMRIFQSSIPRWLGALQGRRFMRWGAGERRFSRPIRWLVALLDEKLIPLSLDDTDPVVSSGITSRGNRLSSDLIEIKTANKYIQSLEEAGIFVNRDKRRLFIKDVIGETAERLNSIPDLPKELLEELTDLVEAPILIEGEIKERYLKLPPEVLSTVMKVHQRYVPLYRVDSVQDPLALESKNVLLPSFLFIANNLPAASDSVKSGNERVLKARLADAEFFIESDRSVSSGVRTEQLASVTFSEGLGTLQDRVKRMEWLAEYLAKNLDLAEKDIINFLRATSLCKHDLVSQMVGEFPELQGVIGGKYLLEEGENRDVALGVLEHYLPRGSRDSLPQSNVGAALAITERIEILLSIFSKGERPSGSSDPYALRRAGNGFLQIVWSKGWNLNLNLLLEISIKHWSNLFPSFEIDPLKLQEEISDFLRQRIFSLLEECQVDLDLVHAVAGESISIYRLLSDPLDVKLRAELLSKMRATGQLSAVQAVVTRASKLAAKSNLSSSILSPSDVVDPNLFEKESEFEMLEVLKSLEPIVNDSSYGRYKELADKLISGAEVLGSFFDGEHSVMVMAEEENVRANRLNLLAVLTNQASIMADFSQIS